MTHRHRLGRKPRSFDPRVPHMSALAMRQHAAVLAPPRCDYTDGMPEDLGVMLNQQLGCCTAAGFYHARQVWTHHTGQMITEPDDDVLALYEATGHYDPADPSSDQGANEQEVLRYLVRDGAPIGPDGAGRDRLLSFVEVDPRNIEDVRSAIYMTGLVYIGFEVPEFLIPEDGNPPPRVWDDMDPSAQIIGGHCVVLPGYSAPDSTLVAVSWGERFTMTEAFFATYVDEVYALTDRAWTQATGRSLLGLSADEHAAQMKPFHLA